MENNLKVESLVNKFVATNLAKGVQPEDLASALFEKEYEEFSIVKNRETDCLIVKISFFEISEDDSLTLHKFKYSYEMSTRMLNRIEQAIGNKKFKTQWDREETIIKLMGDIKSLISPEEFRALYRKNLSSKLISKLSLVA